jgi:hypothetical protein
VTEKWQQCKEHALLLFPAGFLLPPSYCNMRMRKVGRWEKAIYRIIICQEEKSKRNTGILKYSEVTCP